MAAIKYEKDRAANTLLPNYNTYGRYDIPSYYESYWQSPEERYYTGLFVVQILCLITSLFHLFASLGLIYGVHTWSRYLVVPWLITTLCAILTSLAYCITWWAGDVRDYWLALTIIVFFTILVNCYCFTVVWVFYKRMDEELKYYEGKKMNKYNKFTSNQGYPYDPDENDFAGGYPEPQTDPRWPNDEGFNYRRDFPDERFDNIPGDPLQEGFVDDRPKSVPPFHPTVYDDFADVPRQASRHSHRKHSCHCNRHHKKHRRRHRSLHHKDDLCSSSCSTEYTGTEETVSTHPAGRRHHSRHDRHRRSHSRCHHRTVSPKSSKSAVVQVDPDELSRGDSNVGTLLSGGGGFTIPQHIVIPPETNADPSQPRKYQINSEITISYDPKQLPEQADGMPYARSPNPISFTSNV
uniref:Conserved plasma membrane protein n=2 Tax=Bursaphelenchus xylophilus TaxID=6326 RepID=A0A1I7SWD8_BURXY